MASLTASTITPPEQLGQASSTLSTAIVSTSLSNSPSERSPLLSDSSEDYDGDVPSDLLVSLSPPPPEELTLREALMEVLMASMRCFMGCVRPRRRPLKRAAPPPAAAASGQQQRPSAAQDQQQQQASGQEQQQQPEEPPVDQPHGASAAPVVTVHVRLPPPNADIVFRGRAPEQPFISAVPDLRYPKLRKPLASSAPPAGQCEDHVRKWAENQKNKKLRSRYVPTVPTPEPVPVPPANHLRPEAVRAERRKWVWIRDSKARSWQ